MKFRILVSGSSGLVGRSVIKELEKNNLGSFEIFAPGRSELKYTFIRSFVIDKFLNKYKVLSVET